MAESTKRSCWVLLGAALTFFLLFSLGIKFGSYTPLPVEMAIPMGHLRDAANTPYQQVYKYGNNPTVAGGAEDIWDCPDATEPGAATYPFPSTAQTVYVSSDNAADATFGITIIGLDANWEQQTVETSLGAAAAVSGTAFAQVGTASNWMRVFRAYNSNAATTAYTGTIYIHTDAADTGNDGVPDSGTTQILACILPGEGQTQMAIYTIPDGFRGLLVGSSIGINPAASANTRATDTSLITREPSRAWRIQEHVGLVTVGTGQYEQHYKLFRSYPARTDIRWRSDTPSASLEIKGTFSIILVPEGEFL
jgi:hypothetical protein